MNVDGEGVPETAAVLPFPENGRMGVGDEEVAAGLFSCVMSIGSKMELKAEVEWTCGMACLIERGRWRAKKEEAATSVQYCYVSTSRHPEYIPPY